MDFTYDTEARAGDSGSRERLAWAVLLGSFATWLALALAVPVGVSSFLHNASRPLVLAIQANEGTVGIATGSGQRDAIFVGEPPRNVEGRASILTSTTDTALISVFTPDELQVLSRIQIYPNTGLAVTEASAPRFSISAESYELALNLNSGRVRINLPEQTGRPVVVHVQTPQEGVVVLEQSGQYSFDVTNAATSVVVLEGTALVQKAEEQRLLLGLNERALIMAEGGLDGPLDSERNLVSNGDFDDELQGWTPFAWEEDLESQEAGSTTVVDIGGEQALRFRRIGQGHADGEIRQVINQDVTDFQRLELFVTMQIVEQSLGVCGVQGSECPLFVRLTYDDVHGTQQTWQQGFFAVGEFVAGSTPDVCQFCAAPRNPHLRVPLNQIYFFESGNLMERLALQNIEPRFIKSLSLAASGHSFDTQVLDVGLVAVE